MLVVQEEHDEAHGRHLRDEVEAAAEAGEPEPPVAQGRLHVRDLDVLLAAGAEHERTRERTREDESRDEEQTGFRAAELR